MKLEIRILIASVFVSLTVQAAESADAIGSDKNLSKAKMLEKSEKVKLLRIAMQVAGGETKGTGSIKFNKQLQDFAALWDATVDRSQDIQFVIQKLLQNNNTLGMRTDPIMILGTWMPNLTNGAYFRTQQASLNETESIMLYKIIRDTACKLVSDYKVYCRLMHDLVDDHDIKDDEKNDALACRASLVALAGEEAVTKLDESNGFTKLIK